MYSARVAAHYDAEKLAEYARNFARPTGETSPVAAEAAGNE